MAMEKLGTQVRRKQITQAALELVADGGLKKLSVAALARRIGLVPSALYRHFEDKGALLDAIVDLIECKLLDNVEAVCLETTDSVERLYRLLLRHVKMIRENRGIPLIIFSQDFYAGHTGRRKRIYGSIRNYLSEVARLLSEAQQASQIDPTVDVEAAAVMFLGLIQPSAILWHMSDGEFDITRQAQRAWPIFLKALK